MRLLLLIVLAASLLAAPARAEPPTDRPLTGTRYTASLEAAVEFWHASPDCRIRFYAASDAQLLAFTGVASEAATYQGVDGPDCPIWLSDRLTAPSVENRLQTALDAVHEIGHRLGYVHDRIRYSIMNPVDAGMPWPVFRRFAPRGYLRVWRDEHFGEPWATRPGG